MRAKVKRNNSLQCLSNGVMHHMMHDGEEACFDVRSSISETGKFRDDNIPEERNLTSSLIGQRQNMISDASMELTRKRGIYEEGIRF